MTWTVVSALPLALLPAAAARGQDAATTAPSARAQAKPAPKAEAPTGPCVIELDTQSLVLLPDVMDTQIVDPIWDLKGGAGKKLIQIPFKINMPAGRKEPINLTTSSVRVKGGLAVAWHVIDEHAPRGKGSESEIVLQKTLPKGIPTLARKITIDPDNNVVRWPMERAIVGASVKAVTPNTDGELYILKLDAKQLNARNPGPPPTIKRNAGEDERSYLDRANAASNEHKIKNAAFTDLSKRVRALPDDFETPTPTRLWLVIDLSGSATELEVTIDPTLDNAPQPWRILNSHLQQLRKYNTPFDATTSPDKASLPREATDMIATLTTLVGTQNPVNYRLAANQISYNNLAKWATPGDPLYKLLESLIKTGDPYVIQVMIKELGTIFPPTSASGSLLLIAQPFLNPMDKVAILRDKLKNKADLRALKDTMLDINSLMGDASAAAPGELIDQLVVAADSPERLTVIAQSLQFESMGGKRLDQAITRVIETAPSQPLSARILDQKLLGSPNPTLTLRTLQLLASADSADKRVTEIVNDSIADLVFGPSRDSASLGQARIKMTGHIALDSPQHSFLRLLSSGDAKTRELVWQSLVHFTIADSGDPSVDLYRQIVDTALELAPIPPQLISFLAQQPNPSKTVDSLFRVILVGKDAPASLAACKALKSCKGAWPVDKNLARLSFGDRYGLAARIYEFLSGEKPPLPVGLLRQRVDNLPLAIWFGGELASDRLPKAEAWAAQMGDEDRLLELVMAADNDLATAAASTLMYASGSDDKLVAPLLARFRAIEEPTPDKVKEEWKVARQELYTARIQRVAGPIRLRFEVLAKGVSIGAGIKAPDSKQPNGNPDLFELGTTDFIANTDGIKLANDSLTVTVATTQLGIRVEKPAELKAISPELLSKVPLDKVNSPALLAPKDDGSWRGLIALPDGRVGELAFIPVTH